MDKEESKLMKHWRKEVDETNAAYLGLLDKHTQLQNDLQNYLPEVLEPDTDKDLVIEFPNLVEIGINNPNRGKTPRCVIPSNVRFNHENGD